jgi:hypothetical protein
MQEDKKLHSLLTRYAMKEPSARFDESVMQMITKSKITHATSFTGHSLQRLLIITFMITTAALLITAFFFQPQKLLAYISFSVPVNVYKQLFSFLAVFWIVMLINFWWNKKNAISPWD